MSYYGSDSDESDCEDEDFSLTKSERDDLLKALLAMQNMFKDLSARCKLLRVPKRSANRTKVKVSSKISKSPASAPVVIAPISVPPPSVVRTTVKVAVIPTASPLLQVTISSPLVIAPVSSALPSSEISVALTIDRERTSNLPTDEESPHVPQNILGFPRLAQRIVAVDILPAVDAKSKVGESIPVLVVPVVEYTKQEAPSDPKHGPPAVEQCSSFSINSTVQKLKCLFHTFTLHQFELGRDPPVISKIADSKTRFGLVENFQDVFNTCTLDQFELGRDPPNVLDIGDSRFGFG